MQQDFSIRSVTTKWYNIDDGRAASLMLKVGYFLALARLQLFKGGVITTMCGIAECVAMTATPRYHQGGCWPKTEGVMVVFVRVF